MSTFYKIIKLPLACFFLIYTTTPDDKIAYLLLLHAIVTFIRHHYCNLQSLAVVFYVTILVQAQGVRV